MLPGMPAEPGPTVARAWAVSVGGLGVATVFGARQAARYAAGTGARPDLRVVRVLGARQTAQGVIVLAAPTTTTVGLAVFADAAHALSMFALAAAVRRYRRPALLSAFSATASACCGGLAFRLLPAD
jgi:hypothetical protein